MTNDSTTPNARGIIETTLANGHRIGDLTREDAQHILSALRAAANASDGDTITIAADGTLGRLERVEPQFAAPVDTDTPPDVLEALRVAIEERRTDDAFMRRLRSNMDKHADLLAALALSDTMEPLYRVVTP